MLRVRSRPRGPAFARCYSASPPFDQASLLRILRRNAELDDAAARDELRWMADACSAPDWRGADLEVLVRERASGVPLQYVLGDTDFGPLRLLCRAPTLIPRPETAHVFARLADRLRTEDRGRRGLALLDLCTGSAPVPLLLARELAGRVRTLHGVDVSAEALVLARENVELVGRAGADGAGAGGGHNPGPALARGRLRAGVAAACLARTAGQVDVLTANPPYIAPDEYAALPASVRAHEDRAALEAGQDGLAFYTRIAELVPELVRAGPRRAEGDRGAADHVVKVALEIGHTQARDVRGILERRTEGLVRRTACWADQWGRDRMVVGFG